MKTLLIVLALFSPLTFGQTCDVVYTVDTNIVDASGTEHDVSTAVANVYALPMADVLDNSAKALKVLDVMSKLQDKGGPYTIETGEVRSCDGKPPEKVAATSVLVKGVTLNGSNRIAREALKQFDLIVARYEARGKRGDKMGWDHGKARKTKRNDLGQRIKD